jgi:hypothetical protein
MDGGGATPTSLLGCDAAATFDSNRCMEKPFEKSNMRPFEK